MFSLHKSNLVWCFSLLPCALDVGSLRQINSQEANKIAELINYAKQSSDSTYNAHAVIGGYHSINIDDHYFQGQRDTVKRLSRVPFDFKNKTVLDLGCNMGGMLFALKDTIKHGVGVDYDVQLINLSNRLRSHFQVSNLDFYVFDLDKEPLKVIKNFIKTETVDICFLLSMCVWLTNWRSVINFAHQISTHLLFESNGYERQRKQQYRYLKKKYATVTLLNTSSDDDPTQKSRQLYLCSKNIAD